MCISEQDIVHFIGQRDVTVCISLGVLTDHFENYGFEVSLLVVVAIMLCILFVAPSEVQVQLSRFVLFKFVHCMFELMHHTSILWVMANVHIQGSPHTSQEWSVPTTTLA